MYKVLKPMTSLRKIAMTCAASLSWLLLLLASSGDARGEPALNDTVIWDGSDTATNSRYRALRGSFELSVPPRDGRLSVFADARYVLWVNGKYVARGPVRFDPKGPEADLHDVTELLKGGRNSIVVLVLASVSNGKTMRHRPGLSVALDAKLTDGSPFEFRSDATWRTSDRIRYRPPRVGWGSVSDVIDGRVDRMEWIETDFDDSAWPHAATVDGGVWGPIVQRRIPLLREESLTPSLMNGGVLPIELQKGESAVFDIGRMAQGFEIVDLHAAADVELSVEHCQRFVDGTAKESYGAVTRYTTRSGPQQFMAIDSFGCRYLKLTASGAVRIDAIRFVEREYPFAHVGRFESNDRFLNDLWNRCAHTLQMTSDDGYMDCPLRERAEWMGDAAVVQYPVSRVLFAGPEQPYRSDARLMEGMIRRIALGQMPDGRLKAHHPSDRLDIHAYIEDYACLWVQTVREVYERTGDRTLAKEVWPALAKQMELFLSSREGNGLIKGREFVMFDNPLKYKVCQGATLNAFVYRALLDAAQLGEVLGEAKTAERYREAAAQLRGAFNQHLWREDAGTYAAAVLQDGVIERPTAHSALIALDRGIVPDERIAAVRTWLFTNYRQRDGIDFPYTYFWMFKQLYEADTFERDVEVLQQMRNRWKQMMARTDTGTLIESFGGGEASHNFGAVPAYFLSAHVLGARLEGPLSAKRLIIEPRLGDLKHARGAVVTELGVVEVDWNSLPDGLSFSVVVPPGATASLRLTDINPASLTINGSPVDTARAGRWFATELVPGVHRGTARR